MKSKQWKGWTFINKNNFIHSRPTVLLRSRKPSRGEVPFGLKPVRATLIVEVKP